MAAAAAGDAADLDRISESNHDGTNGGAAACARGCSGRGACLGLAPLAVCVCRGGWHGAGCELDRCGAAAAACSGRGSCLEGACACAPGYGGMQCEADGCGSDPASPCSGRGVCEAGGCNCAFGWGGALCDAEVPRCPHGCMGHGQCVGGRCACDDGWGGVDCSRPVCPLACSGHGVCSVPSRRLLQGSFLQQQQQQEQQHSSGSHVQTELHIRWSHLHLHSRFFCWCRGDCRKDGGHATTTTTSDV